MHGMDPQDELDYWRSQARHWQRETERVKAELAAYRDEMREAFGREYAIGAEYQRLWAVEAKRVEELLHGKANAEQAAMLSDSDHAALEWLRNIDWDWPPSMKDMTDQAIDALDRLLARGREG